MLALVFLGLYIIEFQRQIYMYTPASRLGQAGKTLYKNGVFTLCACPINLPLTHYLKVTFYIY